MSRADCDLCDEQVTKLQEQIAILRTELCAAQKNIERRDEDIEALMKELAPLQENNRYLQTMIDDAHGIMGESQLAFAVERSELAKWQEIAIEERCKAIMLIEKLKDVANNADWQTRGLSLEHDEYMQQAARELGIHSAREEL